LLIERSCILVLWVSILPLSLIFPLHFEIVLFDVFLFAISLLGEAIYQTEIHKSCYGKVNQRPKINWWTPPTSHNSHVGDRLYHKFSYLDGGVSERKSSELYRHCRMWHISNIIYDKAFTLSSVILMWKIHAVIIFYMFKW
jgi:hypothetical protein